MLAREFLAPAQAGDALGPWGDERAGVLRLIGRVAPAEGFPHPPRLRRAGLSRRERRDAEQRPVCWIRRPLTR